MLKWAWHPPSFAGPLKETTYPAPSPVSDRTGVCVVAIGISATGDASLTVKLERWPWPWRGDQTEATQKHQRLLHQFGGFSCARELGKKGEVRSKACAGADFGIRWDVADLTNGVDQEEEGYFRDGCGTSHGGGLPGPLCNPLSTSKPHLCGWAI